MNRRSILRSTFIVGAALLAATVPLGSADAVEVKVRKGVRCWINRHRRYLHHHLPRRR